jgi:hypothetical protein
MHSCIILRRPCGIADDCRQVCFGALTGLAGLSEMILTVTDIGKRDGWLTFAAGFILTCLLCVLYIASNGGALRIIYDDTWVYTDLAKRIFFNRSLAMGEVFTHVYPPLYPALISLAYFFESQASVFRAILALNVLAYSSAFMPMYLLFRGYSGAGRLQAFCGAVLTVASCWSLPYVGIIESEALYCPLAVWLVWLLLSGAYLRGKAGFFAFVAIFSAFPLTKAMGGLVFPVFTAFSAAACCRCRAKEWKNILTRPALALFLAAIVFFLYKLYQTSVLPPGSDLSGGYLGCLEYPAVREFAYWLDRVRFNLSWLLKGARNAALPLLLALIFRHGDVRRDPLVIFSALMFGGIFALVPLFTPEDGLQVDHARLYVPFVFTFVVALIRHSRLIGRGEIVLAAVFTCAGLLLSYKSGPLLETLRWEILVYYSLWFSCLYFWRKYFVNAFLLMSFLITPACLWRDRTPPVEKFGFASSLYDPAGITESILEVKSKAPRTEILVDRDWHSVEYPVMKEYMRNMINIRFLPEFTEVGDSLAANMAWKEPALVLTHRKIKDVQKLSGGEFVSLYLAGGPKHQAQAGFGLRGGLKDKIPL